jgi:beta-phosphoglucomutase-like phosphatase (HAD superfamily)
MLQVEPARAAAVEDALSGVRSAAAGRFGLVVGVDRGVGAQALWAAGADVVVDDLAELVETTPRGS